MTAAARPRRVALLCLALLLASAGAARAQEPSPAAAAAYSSAAALQDRGLFDLAADEWRSLVANHPSDPLVPRAQYNLGVCRFQAGDYRQAASAFAQAAAAKGAARQSVAESALTNLGLAQYNLATQLADAQAAESRAAHQRAVAAFDRLRNEFPGSDQIPTAAFYRAESLAALGQSRAAAEAYRAVLADDRASALHAGARLGLATAELDLGQPEQAEATLNTLIAASPAGTTAGEAYSLRGEARLLAERNREAAEDFARAAGAEGYGGAAEARDRQAFALYSAQDYQAAARAYDQLASDYPALPLAAGAQLAAAKCLLLGGGVGEAARRLEALWSESPTAQNAEAAHWLVETLIKQGRHERAVAVAQEALNAGPPAAWSAKLKLGLADALFETPATRARSLPIYQGVATEQADSPQGARAAYLAAHTALVLDRAELASRLATEFCDRHPDHRLAPEARQVAAQAAQKLGDATTALALYRDMLRRYPQDERRAQWRLSAAQLCASAEDWQGVVALLEPATSATPAMENLDAALLLQAKARRASGNLQEAEGCLTRLIEEAPNSPRRAEALYQRGELRTGLDRRDEANQDFRRLAADYDSDDLAPYALYALAANQVAQEDLAGATATLHELLDNYETGPIGEAKFLLAGALERQGEYAEPLKLLDGASGPPAEKLYLRAVCLAGNGDAPAARAAFERLLAKHADHALADRAAYELAWLTRDAGETTQALATFKRLANERPDSPLAAEAWFRAGELLYEQNQHGEAASCLEAALESPAADAELTEQALHLLGWARFEAGDHPAALGAFRRQLQSAPAGELAGDGRVMLGECHYALGQHTDALAAYREALDTPPDSPELVGPALLHAGQAAGQTGDWEGSLRWLDRAAEALGEGAKSDEAAYERAWALVNLKRPEEARPVFQRLVNAGDGPLAARSQFMLGELQLADEKYEDAVRTFFRVAYGYGGREAPAEFHTWQSESLFEAARCLEQLGRDEAARKLYAEVLERFPESEKARHARARLQPGRVR